MVLKKLREYYFGKSKEDKISLALGYLGIIVLTIKWCLDLK